MLTGPVVLRRERSLLSTAGRGRPACEALFFASPKKSTQKKGDPTCCVPALRSGQPAVLGPAGVSCKLASLRQARALIRLALCSSAHPEGGGEKEYRIPEETRTRRGESLLVFVFGIWCPLPIGPCGCAEERRFRRIRAGTCLSRRRVCAGPRLDRAPQVARSEAKGRSNQGRLFFGDFLLAKQKKVTCSRATPGFSPEQSSQRSKHPGDQQGKAC
jgi:hypothetical protein